MQIRYFILVVMLVTAAYSQAGNQTDNIKRIADDRLRIESIVMAENGCYSAGQAQRGVPPGYDRIANAIHIIYTVNHSGANFCTMMLKSIKFIITVKLESTDQAIIIHTINTHKKTVTTRALAIPR